MNAARVLPLVARAVEVGHIYGRQIDLTQIILLYDDNFTSSSQPVRAHQTWHYLRLGAIYAS